MICINVSIFDQEMKQDSSFYKYYIKKALKRALHPLFWSKFGKIASDIVV